MPIKQSAIVRLGFSRALAEPAIRLTFESHARTDKGSDAAAWSLKSGLKNEIRALFVTISLSAPKLNFDAAFCRDQNPLFYILSIPDLFGT